MFASIHGFLRATKKEHAYNVKTIKKRDFILLVTMNSSCFSDHGFLRLRKTAELDINVICYEKKNCRINKTLVLTFILLFIHFSRLAVTNLLFLCFNENEKADGECFW